MNTRTLTSKLYANSQTSQWWNKATQWIEKLVKLPKVHRVLGGLPLLLCVIATTSVGFAANPSINSVTVSEDNPNLGVVGGVVYCDIGKTYNGSLPCDVVAGQYIWRIRGKSFGTASGSVALNGKTVKVRQWTDTEITVDPSQAAIQTNIRAKLAVKTKSGREATSNLSVVPSVYKTIYGQCTWWVSHRRYQANKGPATYSSPKPLDSSWKPQKLDYVVYRAKSHVALVESARLERNGTWTLELTDYNSDGKNTGPLGFAAIFDPKKGTLTKRGRLEPVGWQR